MFISDPNHEFWNPLFIGVPGSRQWRALELSSRLPWFIVTLRGHEEGHEVERTLLVSWDIDLVEIVEGLPARQLLGLQYIEPPSPTNSERWQATPIQAVWRSKDPNGEEADIFVFSTSDGEEFCGTGGRPSPQATASRTLVAQVSSCHSSR